MKNQPQKKQSNTKSNSNMVSNDCGINNNKKINNVTNHRIAIIPKHKLITESAKLRENKVIFQLMMYHDEGYYVD